MSLHNLSFGNWVKTQSTLLTGRMTVTTNPAVLHAVIVNSHSTGTFRPANGTVITNVTFPGGTYTPATGSSVIEFQDFEYTTGIVIDTSGTINATVIYNDLV